MRRCMATPRISAVVLAAGLSRRMGRSKPLLELNGRTVIEHVLERVRAVEEISSIIVVTGHAGERVAAVVRAQPVEIVYNTNYEKGEMLSSVQAGLRALPDGVDAIMIVLCDQPLISPGTMSALAQAWSQRRPRVLLPRFEGKHGHPIVLGAEGIGEILALPMDATLKDYTSRQVRSTIELDVDDPEILRDLDTPQDLARAVEDSMTRRSRSCPTEAIPPKAG